MQETDTIEHRILVPPNVGGELIDLAPDANRKQCRTRIQVIDTGIGIEPEKLEMIFDSDLIKFIRFAFFYSNSVDRTISQAGSEAVAEVVGQQPGLAVDDPVGPVDDESLHGRVEGEGV